MHEVYYAAGVATSTEDGEVLPQDTPWTELLTRFLNNGSIHFIELRDIRTASGGRELSLSSVFIKSKPLTTEPTGVSLDLLLDPVPDPLLLKVWPKELVDDLVYTRNLQVLKHAEELSSSRWIITRYFLRVPPGTSFGGLNVAIPRWNVEIHLHEGVCAPYTVLGNDHANGS